MGMFRDAKPIQFFSESIITDEDILKNNVNPTDEEDIWILAEITNYDVKEYLRLDRHLSDSVLDAVVRQWAGAWAEKYAGLEDDEDIDPPAALWTKVDKVPVEWIETKTKEIRSHIAQLEAELEHLKRAPR